MTIREKLEAMLVERGMFGNVAKAVIDRYLESPLGEPMRGRLDDPLDSYPKPLLAAVWMGVESEALAYIDDVQPSAWYRSMFVRRE